MCSESGASAGYFMTPREITMRPRTVILSLAILLSCLPAAARAAAPSPPAISFEERAVVLSGASAGAKVAWFGVAREPVDYGGVIVRREALVADQDGDGTVRFELDRAVPFRSIWAAVDLTSGEFAVATPAGYPLRELKLNPNAFHSRGNGKLDLFGEGREFLALFVARPGAGSWVMTVYDGGAEDEDGPANLAVTMDPAAMTPVGDSPPAPDAFAGGDVFVAIDPNAMDAVAIRLVGAKP